MDCWTAWRDWRKLREIIFTTLLQSIWNKSVTCTVALSQTTLLAGYPRDDLECPMAPLQGHGDSCTHSMSGAAPDENEISAGQLLCVKYRGIFLNKSNVSQMKNSHNSKMHQSFLDNCGYNGLFPNLSSLWLGLICTIKNDILRS